MREARWTSARSGGSRAGPRRQQADEHRVDVRHREEHVARDGPQDAHVARELGEHRRDAVGADPGRGGEALADLALHHRDPARDAGSSSTVRRITVAAMP